MRIIPGPQTPVVNFKQLKDLLLSKDLSRDSELDWVSAGEFRYLDGEDMTGNMVAFQSFARSGNTFMRSYLETLTGVYTGADMDLSFSLNVQQSGLCGEEIVSDSNLTWITKTHWPMPMGWQEKFHAQKMISVVRNPIDVIPSFVSLVNFCSHSLVPEQSYSRDRPEFWNDAVAYFTEFLAENHTGIMTASQKIPTYYVRFEDLRTDPIPVILDLFRFLLDVPSIEGTVIE